MQAHRRIIDQSVDALKRDWSSLEPLDLPTHSVTDRSEVFVREWAENDEPCTAYVKVYANKKHPLQRLFRGGRSRNEVHNLLFFKSIGIATPKVLAWGERRNAIGRIVEEFIITQAVENALQLDEFVTQYCPNNDQPHEQALRIQMARQLGQWTRRMHDNLFIHEDLKWRNILARPSEKGVELFWIDCPKGKFYKKGKQFIRKKLKDCATLDKLARVVCNKEERTTFLKAYLGEHASPEQLSKLCQKIEAYRSGRFDRKDDFQRMHGQKKVST